MKWIARLLVGAALLGAPAAYALRPGMNSPVIPALSAVGYTAPQVLINPAAVRTVQSPSTSGYALPGIMVFLSSGASLTYSVEVTGDDIEAPGYNAATGNWQALSTMSALTATAAQPLAAAVTAIRLHVTAYTSGTATLQFVQMY